MTTVAELSARLSLDAQPFVDGLGATEAQADKRSKSILNGLNAAGKGAGILGGAILGGAAVALNAYSNIQGSSARLARTMGVDANQIVNYARDWSRGTRVSADQTIQAMTLLTAKGQDVPTMYASIRASQRLSVGQNVDFNKSVDSVGGGR